MMTDAQGLTGEGSGSGKTCWIQSWRRSRSASDQRWSMASRGKVGPVGGVLVGSVKKAMMGLGEGLCMLLAGDGQRWGVVEMTADVVTTRGEVDGGGKVRKGIGGPRRRKG